jgi:hypothetical protein
VSRRRPAGLAAALAATVLVAGCGGHPTAGPPAPRHSTASASGSATSTPVFVPHAATARVASWHLPFASARQALVALGGGRVLLAGGLLAGDVSTGRVTLVDLTHGRMRAAAALAVPVHDTAGADVGGVPLVVGGGNATEQDVVQALHGGTWSVVAHLPTTRSDLSVVQRGPLALVVGGYDGSGTPTALLRLSAAGGPRFQGHLAEGVRYAATAVVGRTAYVFGGEVLGHELDAVQAVDLRTGRTRVVARLPVPVGHAMAVAEGRKVLLMGGRVTPDRQTAAMWWFDPATRRVTRAGSLPAPRSDAAVASVGRHVWLLGGEDPSVTDSVVFVNVR